MHTRLEHLRQLDMGDSDFIAVISGLHLDGVAFMVLLIKGRGLGVPGFPGGLDGANPACSRPNDNARVRIVQCRLVSFGRTDWGGSQAS